MSNMLGETVCRLLHKRSLYKLTCLSKSWFLLQQGVLTTKMYRNRPKGLRRTKMELIIKTNHTLLLKTLSGLGKQLKPASKRHRRNYCSSATLVTSTSSRLIVRTGLRIRIKSSTCRWAHRYSRLHSLSLAVVPLRQAIISVLNITALKVLIRHACWSRKRKGYLSIRPILFGSYRWSNNSSRRWLSSKLRRSSYNNSFSPTSRVRASWLETQCLDQNYQNRRRMGWCAFLI